MIAQLVFGCHGTMVQLGLRMGLIALLLGGGIAAALLAPVVSAPGQIGAPEIATATLSSLAVAIFAALFLYTTVWDRWESRFDTMPWSDALLSGKGETGRRASAINTGPCPFTGASSVAETQSMPCALASLNSAASMHCSSTWFTAECSSQSTVTVSLLQH